MQSCVPLPYFTSCLRNEFFTIADELFPSFALIPQMPLLKRRLMVPLTPARMIYYSSKCAEDSQGMKRREKKNSDINDSHRMATINKLLK